MKMTDVKSVYFIGIGGIGMSAIARYFNQCGATVSGYDKTESPLTKTLVNEGIEVFYNEDVERVPKHVDLVVYTPAIPSTHTELNYYLKSDIEVLKRAQVLGRIVNEGDCFAVAGSHGKSTTSAMLAHVFQTSGKNSTAFLGAITANYQSNYISGTNESFVVEADEFDRSFHQINPTATIITSIDSDHLDIYGTMEGVRQGFETYLSHVRKGGKVFIQTEQNCPKVPSGVNVFTYGIDKGDYQATNIQKETGMFKFDVKTPTETIADIELSMGGLYNIENATAVIAMATNYGVNVGDIKKAFATFSGLYRRFETVLKSEQITMIDDYAHHPNEIRAFIEGVKAFYPNKKIGAIFQPHLYSRTQDYAEHFAQSLDLIDEVLVMEIYPAREKPIEGVSSQMIVDKMKKASKVVNKTTVEETVSQLDVDVLVTIGAGDISRSVEPIKNMLKNKYKLA